MKCPLPATKTRRAAFTHAAQAMRSKELCKLACTLRTLSRVAAQCMFGLRLGRALDKLQGFQRLQDLAGAGPHGWLL